MTDAGKLGKGAFGVVHRGWLRRSDGGGGGREGALLVAVKTLDEKEGVARREAETAFYWEALNLALADHPFVVELLGVCVDGVFRAMVLEFCDGGALNRPLKALTFDVWRWGVQLAEALRYLHASGQVHRDIKGANILLKGGVAKLADLGVADANKEFVGEKLAGKSGCGLRDVRWEAPEEAARRVCACA